MKEKESLTSKLQKFEKLCDAFVEKSYRILRSVNENGVEDAEDFITSDRFRNTINAVKGRVAELEVLIIDTLPSETALPLIEQKIEEKRLSSKLDQQKFDNENNSYHQIYCNEWDWLFKKAYVLKSLERYEEALKTFQELETKQKEMGLHFEGYAHYMDTYEEEEKEITENIEELKALINNNN